jgi:hypothetical protein
LSRYALKTVEHGLPRYAFLTLLGRRVASVRILKTFERRAAPRIRILKTVEYRVVRIRILKTVEYQVVAVRSEDR